MSDSNLIMDKIREELEKGLPSKRKILSYLLDLLKKDKYPSLSDFEFYDIVGYTYGLFNAEHILNRILNKIKKEYEQAPSKDLNRMLDLKLKILDIYSDLLSKEEYQHLSDSDFNLIVGETFKLNPEFFMDSLYRDLRQRMEKKNIDFNFFVGETFKLNPEFYLSEKFEIFGPEHILNNIKKEFELVDPSKDTNWEANFSVLFIFHINFLKKNKKKIRFRCLTTLWPRIATLQLF